MKKLLSLVIVLGLLIAATGCPSSSTPTKAPTPAAGGGDKAGEKK